MSNTSAGNIYSDLLGGGNIKVILSSLVYVGYSLQTSSLGFILSRSRCRLPERV